MIKDPKIYKSMNIEINISRHVGKNDISQAISFLESIRNMADAHSRYIDEENKARKFSREATKERLKIPF